MSNMKNLDGSLEEVNLIFVVNKHGTRRLCPDPKRALNFTKNDELAFSTEADLVYTSQGKYAKMQTIAQNDCSAGCSGIVSFHLTYILSE